MTPDSAVGYIRNAAQVAQGFIDMAPRGDLREAFADIRRLLGAALEKLGEPSMAMIVTTKRVVEAHSPVAELHESDAAMARYWRDTAAVILKAQLETV